jgi:hypothetical protein
MRAVRLVAVALSTLVGAYACDISPTGVPQPAEPRALLESPASSHAAVTSSGFCAPFLDGSRAQASGAQGGLHCFRPGPSFDRQSSDQRRGNYAVAW